MSGCNQSIALLLAACVAAVVCPGCKRAKPADPAAAASSAAQAGAPAVSAAPAQAAAMTAKPIDSAEALRERKKIPAPPAVPCLESDSDPSLPDLLEQAARDFEKARYSEALECAREATRLDQGNIAAHHFRGASLAELGALDEAKTAYARALALDPDDPEVLRSVADLYVRRLGGRDDLELALQYVHRALPRAQKGRDPILQKELHLLAAMALDDLGRPAAALLESARASDLDPKDREARRERGVSLFELCRFDQARAELLSLVAEEPDAWAEHYLGLIAERSRDDAAAQAHFTRAQALDPDAFRPLPAPPGVALDRVFKQVIDEETQRLPPEAKRGLAQAELQVQDLPEVADLVATDPPLSPGILGLFRPPPDGSPTDRKPSIILYRRNLARAARSEEELRREVRETLLHEVGHLNGEDDEQLRDRGL